MIFPALRRRSPPRRFPLRFLEPAVFPADRRVVRWPSISRADFDVLHFKLNARMPGKRADARNECHIERSAGACRKLRRAMAHAKANCGKPTLPRAQGELQMFRPDNS